MQEHALLKLIGQVNYPWAPLFYSRAGEIAERIKDRFSEASATLAKWSMRDVAGRHVCTFEPHVGWVAWEGSVDEAAFGGQFVDLWRTLREYLKLEKATRVAYRAMVLWPTTTFDEALSLVQSSFCSASWRGDLDPPHDMLFVLEYADPGVDYGARIRVAPIRRSEFTDKHAGLLSFPEAVTAECGCFADIDVWTAPKGADMQHELAALRGQVRERISAVARILGQGAVSGD